MYRMCFPLLLFTVKYTVETSQLKVLLRMRNHTELLKSNISNHCKKNIQCMLWKCWCDIMSCYDVHGPNSSTTYQRILFYSVLEPFHDSKKNPNIPFAFNYHYASFADSTNESRSAPEHILTGIHYIYIQDIYVNYREIF